MTFNLQKYALLNANEIIAWKKLNLFPVSTFCVHPSAFLSLYTTSKCTDKTFVQNTHCIILYTMCCNIKAIIQKLILQGKVRTGCRFPGFVWIQYFCLPIDKVLRNC